MQQPISCIRCFAQFSYSVPMCLNNVDCVDDSEDGKMMQRISGAPNLRHYVGRFVNSPNGYHPLCDNCGNDDPHAFQPVCPYCRADIYTWQQGNGQEPNPKILTLAVTGARNSGKTVYMVGLIESLREMAHAHQATMFGVLDSEKNYDRDYKARLFEDGMILDATTIDRQQELVFGITRSNGENIYLILRDIAGENVQNASAQTPELSYIDRSDLTMFMFDPYTLGDVMSELRHQNDTTSSVGVLGEQVIHNILQKLISRENTTTSLALVVGKFDIIQRLGDGDINSKLAAFFGNSGLSFMTDESLENYYSYSEEERQILDTEVRSLFGVLDGRRTLQAAETAFRGRENQLSTFAVSALGAPPKGSRVSSTGVAPFRCVDPLMWAFHRKFGEPLF